MPVKRATKKTAKKLSLAELNEKQDEFCDHPDRVTRLRELAKTLGVSFYVSLRFGVGWNGWAWTFPMRDVAGNLAGFRTRRPDGQKRCVPGSRDGLFYIPLHAYSGTGVFICEGPSDTLALLSIGLDAVGRPSCQGCAGMIGEFCQDAEPIVIVADNDEPGRRGAHGLADKLVGEHGTPGVHIIAPAQHKDAREFVAAGGESRSILDCISEQKSNLHWTYLH